jgi:hypothetical protein
MTALLRPVTKMKCSMPASRASSTPCWINGRSTAGSISFGMAFVAGTNLVPNPATGKTALRMGGLDQLRVMVNRGTGDAISADPAVHSAQEGRISFPGPEC